MIDLQQDGPFHLSYVGQERLRHGRLRAGAGRIDRLGDRRVSEPAIGASLPQLIRDRLDFERVSEPCAGVRRLFFASNNGSPQMRTCEKYLL